MNRKLLNKEVQSIFSDRVKYNLKIFSEYLISEKPDILVLVARKAICLFELFDFLNIPLPECERVSDRILDLDPEYLKGKKVIVVDDTLIVGTTLESIEKKLLNYDIDYKIAVFCVDKENWNENLIVPSKIQEYYSANEVTEFCINEVKALSIISRPYLVDFPISNFVELKDEEFINIINDNELNIIRLPTQSYSNLNFLYSCFFNDNLKNVFFSSVGEGYREIVETIKIRIFISSKRGSKNTRFVPIILFKPLDNQKIETIFNHIIDHYSNKKVFLNFVNGSRSRLRFIQYYLSVNLGFVFINHFKHKIAKFSLYQFKSSEIINLLGKLVGTEMEKLCYNYLPNKLIDKIKPNCIECKDKYNDIFIDINFKGYNIIESFQNIFSNLYTKREIPARIEIKAGNLSGKYKNRLKEGIPFSMIAKTIADKLDFSINEKVTELLSICLDLCNDLGSSIPIICKFNDVYYRGYRHGELGKRTPGNIYLFYKFLSSFCNSSNYDYNNGFNSLLIEKLAVLFFRVGGRKDFIDTIYGMSDPDAINMGFYLMGTVMIKNEESFFPSKRSDWFITSYCYNLLKYDSKKKKYYFDKIPNKKNDWDFPNDGESQASTLGRIFGKTFRHKESYSHSSVDGEKELFPPIDERKLTILVSCYSAGDLAMALAAELAIIKNWIDFVSKCFYGKRYNISHSLFDDFQDSTVFQSFNQGLFKLSSSFNPKKKVTNILKEGKDYLVNTQDELFAIEWKRYMEDMKIGHDGIFNTRNTKNPFFNLIFKSANMLFFLGNHLHEVRFLRELYELLKLPKKIGYNSIFNFINLETNIESKRKIVKKRSKEIDKSEIKEIGYLTSAGRAFIGKMIGDLVDYNKNNKVYKFKVIDINNISQEINSIKTFEDFNNNISYLLKENPFLSEYLNVPSNYINLKKIMNLHKYNEKFDLNKALYFTLQEINLRYQEIESIINEIVELYRESKNNKGNKIFFC